MHSLKIKLLFILLITTYCSWAQVTINGTTVDNGGGEYTLTPKALDKAGGVWSTFKINLKKDLDIQAELFLGDDPSVGAPEAGADGMMFALMTECIFTPDVGPQLGFGGTLGNSLNVEFDTYQNGPYLDPVYDHIALHKNANVIHGSADELVPFVQMSSTNANVEDNAYHDVRIRYNHATTLFTVDFDGVNRISHIIDIPAVIFGGDSLVLWGFTASSGGLPNEHKVKLNAVSDLVQVQDTTICDNANNPFTIDSVAAGVAFTWSPNDGSIDDVNSRAPVFNPLTTTTYTFSVADACEASGFATEEFTAFIKPVADLSLLVNDTAVCSGESAVITLQNSQAGAVYSAFRGATKIVDVTGTGSDLNITIPSGSLSSGTNVIKISASGCVADAFLIDSSTITVVPNPPSPINGPAIVCEIIDTATYTTTTTVGVTHDWSIANGSFISSSNNTDIVKVNLGDDSDTITITTTSGGVTCSNNTVTKIISKLPLYNPDSLLISADSICAGNTITFNVDTSITNTNITYGWILPSGSSILSTNSDSTSITVQFANSGNQSVSLQPSYSSCYTSLPLVNSDDLVILTPPIANAGEDIFMDAIGSTTLDGSASTTGDIYEYLWSTSSTSIINSNESITTLVDVVEPGQSSYTLTVNTDFGPLCTATDEVIITIPFKSLEIPNIFSPNEDGNHDFFEIKNIEDAPDAIVYIYNQWGELVFESVPGYTTPWDGKRNGKKVAASAYYYVLEFNDLEKEPLSGSITIVR